jgi:hypothetical protein
MLRLHRLQARTSKRTNRKRAMTTLICGAIFLVLMYVAYRATKPDPMDFENQKRGKHARNDEE